MCALDAAAQLLGSKKDCSLDAALDKLLERLKPRSVNDLLAKWSTKDGKVEMQEALIGLEETFRVNPPESREEAEMRLAFYAASLELRRQENMHRGKQSYSISAEDVAALLKTISVY